MPFLVVRRENEQVGRFVYNRTANILRDTLTERCGARVDFYRHADVIHSFLLPTFLPSYRWPKSATPRRYSRIRDRESGARVKMHSATCDSTPIALHAQGDACIKEISRHDWLSTAAGANVMHNARLKSNIFSLYVNSM